MTAGDRFYDLLHVSDLPFNVGMRLKQVQQEFKWQAIEGRQFSGLHTCLEGEGEDEDREALILTTDRTFAAMSELLRQTPEPGFPVIKRVHGFVDFDDKPFWAVVQRLSTPLEAHLRDEIAPEMANFEFNEFQYAWEAIQADPVDANDYHGDLDIRKFYHDVDDFESRTHITFEDLGHFDFAVDDSNPASPKLIVTALEKASPGDEKVSQISSSIPVSPFAVFAMSDPD
jgi:hypothetical protein